MTTAWRIEPWGEGEHSFIVTRNDRKVAGDTWGTYPDKDEAEAGLAAANAYTAEAGTEEHEFAFEVTLYAALRIKATTRDEAVRKLRQMIDAADTAINYNTDTPLYAEVSMDPDDQPDLFEIDGTETPAWAQ